MKHEQHVGSHSEKKVSMELAWYITGFVDGEGCFSVSYTKRSKLATGIEVRPSFALGQNKRNLEVLKVIHAYFGCGAIRFSKADQMYKYEVRSIGDLRSRVIPHFKKFPLMTDKQTDFETFAFICDQVASSKHLNSQYLKQIIDLSFTMNKSGKRKYTQLELLKILNEMKV